MRIALFIQIIPYQELLGNYDGKTKLVYGKTIIPYQELLGNYDRMRRYFHVFGIIPYQELLGNYDKHIERFTQHRDYTIPRAIREL